MFSHIGNEEHITAETEDVGWMTLDEISKLPNLHGHARQIVSSALFKEVYNKL
jgi:hypothetical protein